MTSSLPGDCQLEKYKYLEYGEWHDIQVVKQTNWSPIRGVRAPKRYLESSRELKCTFEQSISHA